MASAKRGRVAVLFVGPVIEIRLGFDVESKRVFDWVLGMCLGKRIWCLMWEPPCTTFSIARSPKLRTIDQPEGKDPLEFFTAVGNLHLYSSLGLELAQMLAGHYHIGEQPKTAYSRRLGPWRALIAAGCYETLFNRCRYGRDYTKPTVLMHNAFWLQSMGLRCQYGKDFKHTRLEGSRTTAAAAYST